MTARRVVTLLCDKPGYRESFVGGADHFPHQVRAEARKLAGWRSTPSYIAGGHTDVCRWHA